MQFDRYRAYAASEGTASKWFLNRATGAKTRRVVDSWPTEDVAFEGEPDAEGLASFHAGETEIARVVFYRLVDGEEVVCGSVDLGESGAISVGCPDPDPEADEVEL